MIKLYYSTGTASLAPHFLLQELGLAHELVLVDTSQQQNQQPDYLKLNPLGTVPLLIDGDLFLSESAAICLHLADRYSLAAGQAHLVPALGTPERAALYKWMLYLSNTLQAELMHYFRPGRLADGEATAAIVKTKTVERIGHMLAHIDASLAAAGTPFLLSQQCTIADLFLFMLCRWTRGMAIPARDYPHLGPYVKAMFERPAIRKVFETEGIVAPYY